MQEQQETIITTPESIEPNKRYRLSDPDLRLMCYDNKGSADYYWARMGNHPGNVASLTFTADPMIKPANLTIKLNNKLYSLCVTRSKELSWATVAIKDDIINATSDGFDKDGRFALRYKPNDLSPEYWIVANDGTNWAPLILTDKKSHRLFFRLEKPED